MDEDRQLAAWLSAWGDCHVIGRLLGGYRNSVLLVEREHGRGNERENGRFVAKSSRRSREAIAWLEPVQEAARAAGFVVPRLVPSVAGELQVGGVTLETWIEGGPPAEGELARVLHLVRNFHYLTRDLPQRPGFASSLELLEVERGGDADLSGMPENLVQACRDAWRQLQGERLSAVHGDLNAGNLLITPAGRIALLDWDEARVDVSALDEAALAFGSADETGPRSHHDLRALLAWEVAVSWQAEPEYARRLGQRLFAGQTFGR